MYKKKRGFTLVELSVYLSILSIILLIFTQSFGFLKSIKESININNDINKIHDFLMIGKSISREKNKDGLIIYRLENNTLYYILKDDLEDGYEKSYTSESLENVKIDNINGKSKAIAINSKGTITTPCTIDIKDNRENEYKITVNIGGGTIDIKK